MQTITYIQVRSKAIVTFEVPLTASWKRYDFSKLQVKPYCGFVQPHARKRLRSAIDIFVQRSPVQRIFNPVIQAEQNFRMSFVTLTQPNDILLDASQCYTLLLKEFLRDMRRKYGLKDYIWKFEFQGNGQGHYHLTFNQFFHYAAIQDVWNKKLRNAGQLVGYAKRYGHFKPNSIDVHSMESVYDCEAYLSKELCKGVQNRKVAGGKWWDCSEDLHRKRFSYFIDKETEALLYDGIQNGFGELINLERCKIIRTDFPERFLSKPLLVNYSNYIFS